MKESGVHAASSESTCREGTHNIHFPSSTKERLTSSPFAEMRVRVGHHSPSTIRLLITILIHSSIPFIPISSIHSFPRSKQLGSRCCRRRRDTTRLDSSLARDTDGMEALAWQAHQSEHRLALLILSWISVMSPPTAKARRYCSRVGDPAAEREESGQGVRKRGREREGD